MTLRYTNLHLIVIKLEYLCPNCGQFPFLISTFTLFCFVLFYFGNLFNIGHITKIAHIKQPKTKFPFDIMEKMFFFAFKTILIKIIQTLTKIINFRNAALSVSMRNCFFERFFFILDSLIWHDKLIQRLGTKIFKLVFQ